MRNFGISGIFVQANAISGQFFFRQILMSNVKTSCSCYVNVFIILRACPSCSQKMLRVCIAAHALDFIRVLQRPVKPSVAISTSLRQVRRFLWIFRGRLKFYILIPIQKLRNYFLFEVHSFLSLRIVFFLLHRYNSLGFGYLKRHSEISHRW